MINIENTIISKKSKIYTIAEIGVNHNGLINNAIKMINFANEAGFNAVKFQTYDVNEMLTDRANLANYQKKTKFQNMKSMLKKYSLTFDQFNKLKAYCKRKRITFLSTPGQAYNDGLGFVQFYFGLPIAIVIICMIFRKTSGSDLLLCLILIKPKAVDLAF